MRKIANAFAIWVLPRREPLTLAVALLLAVALGIFMALRAASVPAQAAAAVPAPSAAVLALGASSGHESTGATATFAGGCFWGVQAVFQHTQGVLSAVSGYAGGEAETATYKQVNGGRSGHAETVQIRFDPEKISYGDLLQLFFAVAHDPTQRNRQGPDTGHEYRSVVFYENEAQRQIAAAYIRQIDAAQVFRQPIATELARLNTFYPAEPIHQNYAHRNPEAPYIIQFDAPKLLQFKAVFPKWFRAEPMLVPL